MGFFKGIGKLIKKNVNFKTLVKVGAQGLGTLPGVGGVAGGVISNLQDAHEAKRAQRSDEAQMKLQQASSGAGKAVGSLAGQFASQTLQKAYDQAGNEIKDGIGKVGAEVANSSIKQWFKKHWKAVGGIVVGLVAVIVVMVRWFGHKGHKRPVRR